jgi:hypothetical protein
MKIRMILVAVLVGGCVGISGLQASAAGANDCSFTLGFKTLHDLIPSIVGDCLVNEHHNPTNGDGLQEATGVDGKGGLLVWRKADNWTAYTDGNRTWINGPQGLQSRLNSDRFTWEQDQRDPGLYIVSSAQAQYYPWPNFPSQLNAGASAGAGIVDLHWTRVDDKTVTATGTGFVDNCIPDCARGTYVRSPVSITASQPKQCTVKAFDETAKQQVERQAYVYTAIDMQPAYAIYPGCT